MSGNPISADPAPARRSFDPKLASKILVQLNIVRKNSKIYANDHPALQASVKRTLLLLDEFFATTDAFSLAVTRDSLFLGEYEYPRQNVIVAEFVSHLHSQSIYVFTLKRGITEVEFLHVNRLLSMEGKSVPAETSLDQAVARLSGGHAEVRLIDWSTSEFTDETDIDLARQASATESGETSWESFIRRLLQQEAEDLQGWTGETPLDNISEGRLDALVTQAGRMPDPVAIDPRTAGAYLRKGASPEADSNWRRVCRVASCVMPGLHAELLQSLELHATPSLDEKLKTLEEKGAQLVLSVLEGINGTGRMLHPKVLKLVEMLAESDPASAGWRIGDSERPSQVREISEEIRALLTADGFPSPPSAAGPAEGPWKGDEVSSPAGASGVIAMGADEIPQHYVSILLDLLQSATEPASAESCARAMADFILRSALAGNWEAVAAGWGGLDELATQASLADSPIHEFCHKAKTQFGDAEKLSRLAAALLAYGVDKALPLREILRLAGESQAPQLVETFALADRAAVQQALIPLIIDLKDHTLPHVLRFLEDSRGLVVCRMLLVLQGLGDQGTLRNIERLLLRKEQEVKLEALRTLALLGSPRVPALLLRAIGDSNEKLSLGAIEIARHVPHPEIRRALFDIVKNPRWFKQSYDLPRKTQAVRSLIAMGQPEIFQELYRLAAKRPFLHGKDFRRLRVEMFKSLAQVDLPEPGNFLRLGRSLGGAEIATSCREIERRLRAKGRAAPPETGKGASG